MIRGIVDLFLLIKNAYELTDSNRHAFLLYGKSNCDIPWEKKVIHLDDG